MYKAAIIVFGLLLQEAFIPTINGQTRFGTGDNTTAEEFDRILKAADRATRDLMSLPPAYSIKKYAPPPQQQGLYGTCVAWSSAYGARTISYAIRNNLLQADSIKKYAFSPGYLYYKVKPATDANCGAGLSILSAMQEMSSQGVLLKNTGIPDCVGNWEERWNTSGTTAFKIKDYLALNKTFDSITKNDILRVKKSLSENKPVVLSMRSYRSMEKVTATGIWNPSSDEPVAGRHAVCLVGYDDKKNGGAFEALNSWGPNWGNKGFFWLTYAQLMKYGTYLVELMDFEQGNSILSGNIEFIETDSQNREKGMPVFRGKSPAETGGTEFTRYLFTKPYTAGTRFKMKFSSSAPCYIYVFAQDTKGMVSRLFPPAPTISAAVNSPLATYYFPSDSTHARLDNTVGKETFCIIYSKSAVDFEGLVNYIRDSGVSVYKAVQDRLGTMLLNGSSLKFREDKIIFSAPAREGSALCFFVEMDHQ